MFNILNLFKKIKYSTGLLKKSKDINTSKSENLITRETATKEKHQAVVNLAIAMAHEIKNPLTSIKTFTEYLPQKKDDPVFMDKFIKIVENDVDRIDELIHKLLDFTELTPLLFEDVKIHHFIDNILDEFNEKFTKHNIYIKKSYLSTNITVNIDPVQFKKALVNIIDNAIESMNKGGTITVMTNNLDKNNITEFQLSISDTGSGIDAKDLPFIFDPFFTQKDKCKGLGLAISYGIIKLHNGRLKAENNVDKGSVFTISLPDE